ncbi:hypothetical protein L9F63_027626, partial [Diploptera punctata]
MELEKQTTRSTQDRPTTRHRRENIHISGDITDSSLNHYTDSEHRDNERPISRRGMLSRQTPIMEDRPYTQQNANRPVTGKLMRPPSASAFPSRTGVIPGTASRLATAMMQQPLNRIGTAMSLAGAQ